MLKAEQLGDKNKEMYSMLGRRSTDEARLRRGRSSTSRWERTKPQDHLGHGADLRDRRPDSGKADSIYQAMLDQRFHELERQAGA